MMLKKRKSIKNAVKRNIIFIFVDKPVLYSRDYFYDKIVASKTMINKCFSELRKEKKLFLQRSVIYGIEKPKKRFVKVYWGLTTKLGESFK